MPRRALVVIDMINTYDHEDAERLRESAEDAVPVIGTLVERARQASAPVIYETPLEYLLRQEEIEDIVLTGQATEQCILYSALDAHIRHIPVVVPRDAVAHIHEDLAEAALRMMQLNMEAEVVE